MNLKSKAKKALPYSFGTSLLNLIISLFGMVYLVRYLDEIEYGVLGLFTGLPVMINIFLSFGYDIYITRFIPGMEDKKQVGRIVWAIVIRRLLLVAPLSAILVLGYPWYSPYFKIEAYESHFLYFQISLIAAFIYIYILKTLQAKFLQKFELILRILYQGLRLAVILFGVFYEKDFMFFIKAFAATEVFNLLLASVIFSYYHSGPNPVALIKGYKESPDEKSYRKVSYINGLGTSFLGTDIDRYILGYFSTPTQVAIYVLSTGILKKLLFFYPQKMFKPIAEPAFYGKYDQSQKDSDINRMFQFIFNANNIFGFLVLSLFIPLGKEALAFVFQKPYTQESFIPISIFLFFMVFYSIPLGMVSKAIKKPMILIYSKLAILFNLGFGIPMAYWFGAWGMALATALSVILKNVIIYTLLKRHIKLVIPWSSAIKSMINMGVTIGLILLFKAVLIQNIFILGFVGIVGYGFLMKVNPIFSTKEKKLLLSLIPNKLGKYAKLIL